MKRIINISEEQFKDIQRIVATQWGRLFPTAEQIIADSTLIPEGAEILTKDAYSDLCLRASRADRGDEE